MLTQDGKVGDTCRVKKDTILFRDEELCNL